MQVYSVCENTLSYVLSICAFFCIYISTKVENETKYNKNIGEYY